MLIKGRSGSVTECMFLCTLPLLLKWLIQPYWSLLHASTLIYISRKAQNLNLHDAEEKNCPFDIYSCSLGSVVWERKNENTPTSSSPIAVYCPCWEIMTANSWLGRRKWHVLYNCSSFIYWFGSGEVADLTAIRPNSNV